MHDASHSNPHAFFGGKVPGGGRQLAQPIKFSISGPPSARAASARDARDALVKRVNALEATLADAVSARDAARATLRATRDDAARATTLRECFFRELDARARRAEAEVIRLCRKHDDASRLAFGNRAAVDRSADRAGELEAEDEEVFQECDDDAR